MGCGRRCDRAIGDDYQVVAHLMAGFERMPAKPEVAPFESVRAALSNPNDDRSDRQPRLHKANWRLIGPGLVVAATGVEAGDLVATLIAGSRYALLWPS
jgi:hypothetical protein